MDTVMRWFGIAFFAALTLLGFVVAMWFPIRYSWGRIYKERLSGMQKLKFSVTVGTGLFILLSAFFPLISLAFLYNDNAKPSLDSLLSLFICVGPMALLFGLVAAIGTYIRYSWLDWLIWRSPKSESELMTDNNGLKQRK